MGRPGLVNLGRLYLAKLFRANTVITREYPADWKPGDEPYYPINDARNETLYKQYEELAAQEGDVIFAGRLGGYKYYDMDKAIAAAFQLVRNELGVEPTEA